MHSQKTKYHWLSVRAPSTQVLLSSFERLRSWTETIQLKIKQPQP